ncbi:hypothetical protein ACHAXR_005678, partial [Thalassiosira sp. AJA248-18]
MASAATPINITLSIGDVSFNLTPSQSNSLPSSSPSSSTPPQSRRASPYAVHRKKSQRRRNGLERANSTTTFTQQQYAHAASSPPIVAIRHGSPQPNAAAPINNISPKFPPSSPQSPLQQHILGRVRSMKDKIESQDRRRNVGAATESQSPLFSTSNTNGYCVDLHSFTGTLHISSSKNNVEHSSMQHKNGDRTINNSPMLFQNNADSMHAASTWEQRGTPINSPRPVFHNSPQKRTMANDNAKDRDSIVLSKKRSKRRLTSIVPNENEVEMSTRQDMNGNDEQGSDCDHIEERTSPVRDSKKSVRFSTIQRTDIINPPLSDGKSSQNQSNVEATPKQLSSEENDDPQSIIGIGNIQNTFPSPQRLGIQPQKAKSKHFFSSPPMTAFSSPPRTAMTATARASMNMARETSSMLTRSSKHVLNQITLAGKDVYDVLNGDAANNSANNNKQGTSPGNSRASFLNSSGNEDDDVYDALDGTELHYACASDRLDYVRSLLEYDNVMDLHKVDCDGKLPIHILTENHRLINEDPLGCEEVAFTMIELLGPEKAMHALHPGGLAPFVYVIGMWAEELHRGALARNTARVALRNGTNKPTSEPIVARSQDEDHQRSVKAPGRLRYRSLFNSPVIGSATSSTDRAKLLYLPARVTITDHCRWAIRILSRLIDEYPEQTREAILTNIASVPLFLKSLLLISDGDELKEFLDMSLVKHVIVDKRSINVWLCAMLTDKKPTKMRAVTFMKILSQMTLQDLSATSQSPDRYSDFEIERFKTLREDTFNAVYRVVGIVPAVLELGGHLIENLSTTSVMRYITDRTIRKEKVFFVLICDFFYAIFMLMGYRLNVEFVLSYQSVDGPENYRKNSYISTSTLGIAGYFLVKEFMTLFSLYLTSKKLAKRYCSSVFNVSFNVTESSTSLSTMQRLTYTQIIDVASVAMLLGSEAALTIDPVFLDNEGFFASFTIILLWLKLMGEYRILNSAFSLFLYAVNEVIKEVKWFLIFLMAVTFMFSDAARTVVAARGDCIVGDDITDDFCSDNLLTGIIRMYSVLVGDVALEFFQSSDAMVLIFVLFSFFSIIILLNILIAIIIDSYNGSKQRSREIFYRARIEYAAHLVARKQFLSPRERSDFHVATYVPQKARQALRCVYFVANAIAFLSFEYGFFGAAYFLTLEI